MTKPAFPLISKSFLRIEGREAGFSLPELLIAMAIISVVGAIAVPPLNSYRDKCCLMAVVSEITNLLNEARQRQRALCDDKDYGVGFVPATMTVRLIAGKGADNKWNTADDVVVRSISLAGKGGVSFGHGSYGPRKDCAVAPDGVSLQNNNTVICNTILTGSAGNVYLITRSGSAMAVSMDSNAYGYKLWPWNGKEWVQM